MFLYNVRINFTEEYKEQIHAEYGDHLGRYEMRGNPLAKRIMRETKSYNEADNGAFFFMADLSNDCIEICVDKEDMPLDPGEIADYVERMQIGCTDWMVREITAREMGNLFDRARNYDYAMDGELPVLEKALDQLSMFFHRDVLEENIFHGRDLTEEEIREEAERLFSQSLKEEVDRILSMEKQKEHLGHPVHYLIETDDPEFEREAVRLLLDALYLRNRIASRRYTVFDPSELGKYIEDQIYRISKFGCVMVEIFQEAQTESSLADDTIRSVVNVAEVMREYQNQTLTIFLLPGECRRAKDMLFQETGGCTFVEISQDVLDPVEARVYLQDKAQRGKVEPDERMMSGITDEDKMYTVAELDRDFDTWLTVHLKEKVFPAYSEINCVAVEEKEKKPAGDAYQELQDMVGLTEAKQVIDEAIDYFNAQKLYRAKGLQEDSQGMHMIFTGNPGTAKTTVARLFAQIMKDNGLLSEGDLYEVGRADLVGRYVGWTAQQVKGVFRRAKGSVLFIDEAYSLVDDRDGSYGDEAINTIVQEMENHREDMVVIFAGYPEPMEKFLSKNSGLRSRIAYHVEFSDYTAEELYEIAKLQAGERGMHLGPGVKTKLMPILKRAQESRDFGNGRYVRNLIEQAKRKQAGRLIDMDYDDVTEKTAATLRACDFAEINIETNVKETTIGF